MAEHESHGAPRTDVDAPVSREEANEASKTPGQRITGRSFAGTSFAADQREQTSAHRGESRDHLMDDTVSDPVDQAEGRAPRDES